MRRLHVTIVTNGSLLGERLKDIAGIDELHVSLHSFNDSDWNRITGSEKHYRELVQNNIILVRRQYPDLEIKLNVVSEIGNNSKVDIEKYLQFAKELGLKINVFQEGYLKWASFLGLKVKNVIESAPWWDLNNFSPLLIKESYRKKTYLVHGVEVSLCYTSSDEQSWDSIWLGATGVAYCDIYHKTPNLLLTNVIKSRNTKSLMFCLKSLIKEADYNRAIKQQGQANENISKIESKLAKIIKLRKQYLLTL